MTAIQLLPDSLAQRYRNWLNTDLQEKKDHLAHLAQNGQKPPVMMISCSDSRVLSDEMFGVTQGEFFGYRSVANFVHSADAGPVAQGIGAALQYGVTVLGVSHIIVMGHSACGGVRGCHDMCRGDAPALEAAENFVGRWLDGMRPAYERVKIETDIATRVDQMEREAVILSPENLMSYDFIASACTVGNLQLHGLWTDIASGRLEHYDPALGKFIAI